MLHLGLLITKNDNEIIGPWFGENARYFDQIVCLDGSESGATTGVDVRWSRSPARA